WADGLVDLGHDCKLLDEMKYHDASNGMDTSSDRKKYIICIFLWYLPEWSSTAPRHLHHSKIISLSVRIGGIGKRKWMEELMISRSCWIKKEFGWWQCTRKYCLGFISKEAIHVTIWL
ncbi:MAG: hypothetical protein SOX40_03975, partial [Bacteroidaceae bacterium]|nr:hypothetical protein [Bacteroidaceae bacterium]